MKSNEVLGIIKSEDIRKDYRLFKVYDLTF